MEIQLSDGLPSGMMCNCPYADGGENCKHMAAVLFAAEVKAYSFDEYDNGETEPWEDALERLPEKTLRDLLRELAVDDVKLQGRLIRLDSAQSGPGSAARDRLLEIYMESDPEAAIALLLENREADREPGWNRVWNSEKLIRLYRKTGRQAEYEAELRRLVVDYRYIEPAYLQLLKEITAPDEWSALVEKLLTSSGNRSDRLILLNFEQRYETLLKELQRFANVHDLDRYEKELREWSAEQTRECYVPVLKREMQRATNRKGYWRVVQYLKKLEAYPDGTAAANTLAAYWRECHSNRPAMKDELRKAGY